MSQIYWRMDERKGGKLIKISKMTKKHLENCIRFSENMPAMWREEEINAIKLELEYRNQRGIK